MKISEKVCLFFLLFLICVQFNDCSKKYRYIEKYIGSWDFIVINSVKNYTSGVESTDTVLFEGVIKPGSSDNKILILYSEQDQIEIEVDEGGNMIMYCEGPSKCIGKFEDANTFEYQHSERVNTGKSLMSYSTIIHGKKIS